MPRTSSPLRRSLAMLSVALLAAIWAAGISIPANAAVRGSLDITSIIDTASGLGGPVQNRPFNVVVRVLDGAGAPTTVNQATTVVLEEVSGPGVLGGTTTAVIPRNGSGATISGATYSQFANGVTLRVRAASGVNLAPDERGRRCRSHGGRYNRLPEGAETVTDPNCGAPTAAVPNCGQLLLPNGASGHVTLSVGSCDGLGACRTTAVTEALVVTAIARSQGRSRSTPLQQHAPATLVVACDKDLCRETANGVPSDFADLHPGQHWCPRQGRLPPCPAKGVVGAGPAGCVDYVQSSRSQGDLYLYLLFAIDLRASFPNSPANSRQRHSDDAQRLEGGRGPPAPDPRCVGILVVTGPSERPRQAGIPARARRPVRSLGVSPRLGPFVLGQCHPWPTGRQPARGTPTATKWRLEWRQHRAALSG